MTAQPLIYEQSDIPPGMTCEEYRHRKAATSRRGSRLTRVPQRLRRRGASPRSN